MKDGSSPDQVDIKGSGCSIKKQKYCKQGTSMEKTFFLRMKNVISQ